MKSIAEPYRDVDFTRAKRGAVAKTEPGKAEISIRLDTAILDHFRAVVERAGGGSYQSLINDAMLTCIHQQFVLDAVRQVVKEELSAVPDKRNLTTAPKRTRLRGAV